MIKKQSFPLDPHALPDTGISPQVERQIGRACSCMQPGQVYLGPLTAFSTRSAKKLRMTCDPPTYNTGVWATTMFPGYKV